MNTHDMFRGALSRARENSLPDRDLGLDVIRVWASISMIVAHTADPLDPRTAIGLIKMFVDSAPVWFFFAFGMTMVRLLTKPLRQQLVICGSFLLVALAHNLYNGSLLVWEFLFVLWTAQAIMIGLEAVGPRPAGWYVAAVLACAAATVPGISGWMGFGLGLGGPFRPVPWWGFVCAGFLFGRWDGRMRSGRVVGIGLALVASGIGLWVGAQGSGSTAFKMTRWPLHLPYALLFCGLVVFVYGMVNSLWAHRAVIPSWFGRIAQLSRYLLLATAVHFIPASAVRHLSHAVRSTIPNDSLLNGPAGDWARVFIGGAVAIGLVFWILAPLARLWEWIEKMPWPGWVRTYSILLGAAGLQMVVWIQSPGVGPWSPDVAKQVGKLAALALLVMLSLSHLHRSGKTVARGGDHGRYSPEGRPGCRGQLDARSAHGLVAAPERSVASAETLHSV